MERLLVSENGRDLDRGMTHFERAVGLAGGGVNVFFPPVVRKNYIRLPN